MVDGLACSWFSLICYLLLLLNTKEFSSATEEKRGDEIICNIYNIYKINVQGKPLYS